MRILHTVEFYYPSKGGSQEVVRQLSERMVALGHDVTVTTSWLPDRKELTHNGVKIKEFRISGNEVRGYIGDTDSYKDYLLNEKFDVIMNYAAQQWASDLFFDVMDKIGCRKIFVPCGFSGLHDPLYANYFKKMPIILKKYDKTVYLSPTYRDTLFAKQHNIKNMAVIPNGADENEFLKETVFDMRKELGIGSRDKMIIHIGSFTGMKGQAEAIKIYKAANIKSSTLVLIGNIFDKKTHNACRFEAALFNINPLNVLNKKRILIRNLTRAKTVDALKQADLFLFPSNIEASPLVLFEACAAKTPFLTSDVGNSREIIKWTGGGKLMPSEQNSDGITKINIPESARALRGLIGNTKQLHELAAHGHEAWKKNFTWGIIASKYIDIYRGVNK